MRSIFHRALHPVKCEAYFTGALFNFQPFSFSGFNPPPPASSRRSALVTSV